jgi:hypothetical protein
MEEVKIPLPTELNTPPVTKTYLPMLFPVINYTFQQESI